jgi:hypothetical protein
VNICALPRTLVEADSDERRLFSAPLPEVCCTVAVVLRDSGVVANRLKSD